MITAASLKEYTAKDLAQMAKRRGVTGWHAMRKDELVKALIKAAKSSTAKSNTAKGKSAAKAKNGKATSAKVSVVSKTGKPATAKARSETSSAKKSAAKAKTAPKSDPKVVETIRSLHQQRLAAKDLATGGEEGNAMDRLVLMVRDSFWIHACWEVSRKSIERAKAALAQDWHTAVPVLRVMEVDGAVMTSGSERLVKQIEIHGGVKNWYIDVADPPKSYRCHLGYLATNGRFQAIARSNVVTTPRPGSCEELDTNWEELAENVEKIYALSGGADEEHSDGELREMLEQRFNRPVGMPMAARLGLVADQFSGKANRDFGLNIEVEMIIYGSTKAGSYVTLSGEPVKLREDGTFLVKMDFPDKRQIFPIVARSKDGLEQRTVALAVERNTKTMDPVSHDPRESSSY